MLLKQVRTPSVLGCFAAIAHATRSPCQRPITAALYALSLKQPWQSMCCMCRNLLVAAWHRASGLVSAYASAGAEPVTCAVTACGGIGTAHTDVLHHHQAHVRVCNAPPDALALSCHLSFRMQRAGSDWGTLFDGAHINRCLPCPCMAGRVCHAQCASLLTSPGMQGSWCSLSGAARTGTLHASAAGTTPAAAQHFQVRTPPCTT